MKRCSRRWIPIVVSMAAMSVAQASLARGGWETLPNSPNEGSGRHEDTWFVDDSTGWVVNAGGEVWHTSDGGDSWVLQTDTGKYVRSVTFATPTRGWIGHLSGPLAELMYETFDGGSTWTPVPNLPAGSPPGICAMWAVDEDVIYASGKYSGPAAMLKTTDGGASWQSIDLSPYASVLIDCYFPTTEHGFVVGGIGASSSMRARVLETTDGGTTWLTRHTSSQTGEWCWKISFPSPLMGYVSVERSGNPMRILATTDGGATWTEKATPNSRQQGIGFISDQVGWLGGATPTYLTTDGGTSWTEDSFGARLNRVRVLASGVAYAVGSRVYRFQSPTDIDSEPVLAGSISVRPPYPNPFEDVVRLPFRLLESADVSLRVFDLRGRLVREFVLPGAKVGEQTISWDGLDATGRPVAAGAYVVRLNAARDSAPKTIRLLVVR